ncbi:MAG: 2'-5' RNA ligase family protein [Anaerolineales bacterium]
MKATFAFLADNEIHNLVRKLSWDIHQKYRTGIDVCRLPPHISLKQTFDISNLDSLSDYMAGLAGSIQPFQAHLTHLELVDATIDGLESGILWLNVEETEFLRGLHNRLNEELTTRFGNVPAEFDGDSYHFHMAVAIGGQPIETYRRILHEFKERHVNLQCMVRDLVMFVYDERSDVNAGYMTYMILPLSKRL